MEKISDYALALLEDMETENFYIENSEFYEDAGAEIKGTVDAFGKRTDLYIFHPRENDGLNILIREYFHGKVVIGRVSEMTVDDHGGEIGGDTGYVLIDRESGYVIAKTDLLDMYEVYHRDTKEERMSLLSKYIGTYVAREPKVLPLIPEEIKSNKDYYKILYNEITLENERKVKHLNEKEQIYKVDDEDKRIIN